MLTGEDSTFKSLAALLELFSEFGEGTGTMFVIAAPCSEPKQSLVPATVNDKPDLVREQDDPGNRCDLLCVILLRRVLQWSCLLLTMLSCLMHPGNETPYCNLDRPLRADMHM